MSMIGKLRNFEITGQLGEGGISEIYQAKDRKLDRDGRIAETGNNSVVPAGPGFSRH
jgi:hypothetical protein